MSGKFSGAAGLQTHSPKKTIEHPYNLQRALERFERGYLRNILVLANWNIVYAAEMLGIRPETLSEKMKTYDILLLA